MADGRLPADGQPLQRAMVIDRLPLVRLGVARIFESLGIAVTDGADDVREAIRSLVADPPDYVVLGLPAEQRVLPSARDIRLRHPNVKVIVLLDGILSAELPQLLEIGVAGVALRSTTGRELADVVRSLRRGDRYVAGASTVAALGALKAGNHDTRPGPGQHRRTQLQHRRTQLEVQSEGESIIELTRKERAVLVALAEGRTKRQIADHLYVTPETVKTHVAHLYAKLGVHSRHDAIKRALALGMLT